MALTDKDKTVQDNVIDINIDGATRTRFRINGDPTAIIELNISDLGILGRLDTGLTKLEKDMSRIASLNSEEDNFTGKLKEIDQQMRETVDYIFDYPVSAVCARYGTMYDLKDGKFRYEAIIDGLTKLYTENINAEYKKLQQRIKKHTDKYTSATKGKRK